MFYRFRSLAVLFVSLVVLYANGLSADTINVPADFTSIQAAINAARNGDEVVVAPGTYVENINFNGKAITLRSSSINPADTISDASRMLGLVSKHTTQFFVCYHSKDRCRPSTMDASIPGFLRHASWRQWVLENH